MREWTLHYDTIDKRTHMGGDVDGVCYVCYGGHVKHYEPIRVVAVPKDAKPVRMHRPKMQFDSQDAAWVSCFDSKCYPHYEHATFIQTEEAE